MICILAPMISFGQSKEHQFDFYGESIKLNTSDFKFVDFKSTLSEESIQEFYRDLEQNHFQPAVEALMAYREKHLPDNWLFYQLIRKTAQQFSPKADNYNRYTLYKWYLLNKTGYHAILTIHQDQVLMYVQSDENIYEIPYRIKEGKQFICLNYHDYGNIDFENKLFIEASILPVENKRSFTYKITKLPNFSKSDYQEKDISFTYQDDRYVYRVKINTSVKSIFANYPVVDYAKYFNIPMSDETYNSLIPLLRKNLKNLSQKSGVEYLMHFTRYAFVYKPDTEVFGKEKRFSPEQTLFSDYSDCEDRAALFFYLVKEIYDLPMIVLAYPEHVSIAVKFDKPVGDAIIYNGQKYSICEPTPQSFDLGVGQSTVNLSKTKYEVVYAYNPSR